MPPFMDDQSDMFYDVEEKKKILLLSQYLVSVQHVF